MSIKLTKLSYNFALHFYCVLFETELRETYRKGKEWNFPCFSFLSQKLLRELNLGALEMLSVTLWRRRSFSCYFCSLETPSAPSIFLPCCESPVNRFLSMFVGNMLSLTPWLQRERPSLCAPDVMWELPLKQTPSISTRCVHDKSQPYLSLSFLHSAVHVTSFVLHMQAVRLHDTVFLSFCSGLRPSPSFFPVDCPPPQSEGGPAGGGGEREAGKREREENPAECKHPVSRTGCSFVWHLERSDL